MRDLLALPPDLPVPVDDGACDHLPGNGRELYRRVPLVCERGAVAKAFYPVFPPDRNAVGVLAWLWSRA